MNFGHGFIPRLDARTAAGVDRAVGNPGQPTLDGALLDLPAVIAEASWAGQRPDVLAHLRAGGTTILVDTQGWRYRYPSTLSTEKFRRLPHAPVSPLVEPDDIRAFVRADLHHQVRLGATALLVPGFLPRGVGDDVAPLTELAVEAALDVLGELPPLPLVAFLGAHAVELDKLVSSAERVHGAVSALYVQVTPVNPLLDSPSKLLALLDALRECEAQRFPVIAGHLGAITPLLRAFGITAADAGLGEGERFSAAERIRPARPPRDREREGWRGPRIYARQLGRSLDARVWRALLDVPEIRGRMRCTDPCCRFRTLDTTLSRAVEHSLHGRVGDAREASSLATLMRFDTLADRLERQRSLLNLCNAALMQLGERPIDGAFADNHLATVQRGRRLLGLSA